MTSYLILTLVALLIGVALGWLLNVSRTAPAQRAAAAELGHLRARLEAAHGLAADHHRQQSVEALVAPLHATLDRVQAQLRDVEQQRAGAQGALVAQIQAMRQSSEQLRSEAGSLVTALRAPQVRGRWGEMQLERVVEAAGLVDHVDFETQASVTTPDGTLRPDLVVNLVGGKQIVVDAKVAFSAYLEAAEATDEPTRANRMKAHARQLRTHIDGLAGKGYWRQFARSPEFVVCFVPADAFLDAALREDPNLQEHAFAHDVVLATPSTLVALLRTIAYTWRQDALADNAEQVHALGRELYGRLATMSGHVDKLGRSLGTAVEAYNQAVGSLESRVLVSARRMNELQVVPAGDVLPTPSYLAVAPRHPQTTELHEPAARPSARVVALPMFEECPTGSDT